MLKDSEQMQKEVDNIAYTGALHALADCVTTAWDVEGWKKHGQWKLDAILKIVAKLKEINELR